VTLEYSFKPGFKPIAWAKTELKTEVKRKLPIAWAKTELKTEVKRKLRF